jgi:flagellar assembly factor FliW
MEIDTLYFGATQIHEDAIVTFEHGIPGFQEEKNFVFLPFTEDNIYQIMQSVQTKELAFVVTNPFHFFKDYEFDLDDSTINLLEIKEKEDLTIYTILTIQDPFSETTANLQAPVIINRKNNKAKQLILSNVPYKTKHRLFEEAVVERKG